MSERNKFENAWVQLDAVDVFKHLKITILVQNNNILHHRNLTLTQSASSAELQFSDTKQSLRHWRSLKVLHRVISMSVSAYSRAPFSISASGKASWSSSKAHPLLPPSCSRAFPTPTVALLLLLSAHRAYMALGLVGQPQTLCHLNRNGTSQHHHIRARKAVKIKEKQ